MFRYYPLLAFLISTILAQGLKPFFAYLKDHKFTLRYVLASGGYPSSHSAGVVSLCLAIGLTQGFESPLFAISFAIMVIVLYDAGNVRFYAGRNIQVTKQLIIDLSDIIDESNSVYTQKMKEVLGHTTLELIAGVLLGIVVSLVLYNIWR